MRDNGMYNYGERPMGEGLRNDALWPLGWRKIWSTVLHAQSLLRMVEARRDGSSPIPMGKQLCPPQRGEEVLGRRGRSR